MYVYMDGMVFLVRGVLELLKNEGFIVIIIGKRVISKGNIDFYWIKIDF